MALFEKPDPAAAQARKAAEEFRRRLKENPLDVSAALGLADALTAMGQRAEAVATLTRAGKALQKQGKALEAIAVYKRAVKIDAKGELASTFITRIDLEKLQEATRTAPAPASHPPAPTAPGPSPAAAPAASVPAPRVPAGIPDEIRQKKRKVQTAAAGIPLLKDVPPFLFELVLEKIELKTLEAGDTLYEEGSTGATLVFVVGGELEVVSHDDAGRPIAITTLGPGDVASEISFLSGTPRTATLRARTRTDVLELDRRALDPILKKNRGMTEALQILHRERVLDTVLVRSRLFGGLPREERDWVAQRLTPVAASAGDRIVQEGAADDAVYLLKRGEVRVSSVSAGKEVAIARLTPHDFFGDVAALRGLKRTASVTAETAVELLCLKSDDLAELLARHPSIRSALEEIQLERFVAASGAMTRKD